MAYNPLQNQDRSLIFAPNDRRDIYLFRTRTYLNFSKSWRYPVLALGCSIIEMSSKYSQTKLVKTIDTSRNFFMVL